MINRETNTTIQASDLDVETIDLTDLPQKNRARQARDGGRFFFKRNRSKIRLKREGIGLYRLSSGSLIGCL